MNEPDDQPILQEHPQQDFENEDDPELQEDNEDRAHVIDLTEVTESVKPPTALKRPHTENDYTNVDDEGDMCPICLEIWSDAGEHRLCAVKCGHLFGRNCIEMWLKDNKNCPTCKKRAMKRDLRNLYCNKVVALEESSILAIKARLHEAELQTALLQATVVQHAVQREQLVRQVAALQEELQSAQAQLRERTAHTAATHSLHNRAAAVRDVFRRLVQLKTVQLSSEVGCRVMDHDSWQNAIVCSMKNPTALFGSYGLAKLDMSNFNVIGSMPLHTAPIRDVRFQSAGGSSLLVTASMDKQARVVDTRAPGVARTYAPPPDSRPAPLWSCCWGDPGAVGGSYTLFLGEQQGDVVKLDLRRLTERVSTLKVEGDTSPVVSLQTLPVHITGDCLPGGALLACRLSSLRVFERNHRTGAYELRTLHNPPPGPFMSLAVDRGSTVVGGGGRHALLSGRPNTSFAFARHMYGEFREDNINGNLSFVPIHTFAGGITASLLSRSSVTSQCACAYVENTRTVTTWSLATGQQLPSVQAVQQPVLDVAMFTTAGDNGTNHVLALDDRKLHVFAME